MKTVIACVALVSLGWMASAAFAEELLEGIPASPAPGPRPSQKFMERGGRQNTPGIEKAFPKELLPPDAQALMNVFDAEAAAIRLKAEQEIQGKRQTLAAALQALQDAYTRDAKLDEAVAIRDRIRQLAIAHVKPLPDPGNLGAYINRIGESFYFDVVGTTGFSVWGSEVYTYDSHLATAAIHAGVLKPGQRGIVKVTMIKSPEAHHGSTENGVTTSNCGPYAASYTVERVIPYGLLSLKTAPLVPAAPVSTRTGF